LGGAWLLNWYIRQRISEAEKRLSKTKEEFGQVQHQNEKIIEEKNTIEKEVPVDAASFMTTTTDSSAAGTTTAGFPGRTRRPTLGQTIWNTSKWLVPLIILVVLLVLGYRKHKKEKKLPKPKKIA